MKIAIIGASSFVGLNLIRELKKRKYFITATYNNQKMKMSKSNRIIWKKLDIRQNKKNFYEFLGAPDVVINLAWRDIPNYLSKRHFETFQIQKKFNYNLIKNGLKNLIILGTCYEYGNVKGEISERKTCKPNIPYSKAKLQLLNYIRKKKKDYNFKFTWLRPFFVYGYNKKRETLFSLIKKINQGKKIKIEVPGKLKRDFISVKYLNNVIYKVIKLNKDFGIVNICTGKGKTIEQFIYENLKNKNKIKDINITSNNPNFFEPGSFWGNTKKLNKILKT